MWRKVDEAPQLGLIEHIDNIDNPDNSLFNVDLFCENNA